MRDESRDRKPRLKWNSNGLHSDAEFAAFELETWSPLGERHGWFVRLRSETIARETRPGRCAGTQLEAQLAAEQALRSFLRTAMKALGDE
jgi:hypothetical protein